jgi:hypothetical protein
LLPGLAINTSSSITVLRLSREGFEKSFETKKQKGYLGAYQMVRAKGEEPARLHVAAVEEKAFHGKTISTIYTYFWKNGN